MFLAAIRCVQIIGDEKYESSHRFLRVTCSGVFVFQDDAERQVDHHEQQQLRAGQQTAKQTQGTGL